MKSIVFPKADWYFVKKNNFAIAKKNSGIFNKQLLIVHTHKPEQKNTAISSPQNHCASTKKLSLRPFQDDLSPITFRLDVRLCVYSPKQCDMGHWAHYCSQLQSSLKTKRPKLTNREFFSHKKGVGLKIQTHKFKKMFQRAFLPGSSMCIKRIGSTLELREKERGKRYISNSLSFLNRPLKLGVTPYFLLCFSPPPVTFSFFVQLLYITDCNFQQYLPILLSIYFRIVINKKRQNCLIVLIICCILHDAF